MYNFVIQHLCTLCAHHLKSSLLPSLHIWPLHPLRVPPTHFPSGNHNSVISIYEFVLEGGFVCLFICYFLFYIPHMTELIQLLSISVWFILLSIILSRSIQVENDNILSFFSGWVVFHCIYMPCLLYPIICQRMLRLFLCLGYCK